MGVVPDGSKTAFSVAEKVEGEGRVSTADRYELRLPSDEEAPWVRLYKLLGTMVDYSVGATGTAEKSVNRSVTSVRLTSRMGGDGAAAGEPTLADGAAGRGQFLW